MKRYRAVALLIAFLLAASASACGYHFALRGGIVPENAGSIAVLAFVNKTNEPYVDVEATKAVVHEFLTDGRLAVAGPDSADLVLRGTVVSFQLTPLAYTAASYVEQYSVGIALDVSVEDAKTHKIIWKENGLSSSFVSSYSVTAGDITSTKIAKEAALEKACQDVASTLRSRVLDGF
jgi:Lipopolysaccharide-assembly